MDSLLRHQSHYNSIPGNAEEVRSPFTTSHPQKSHRYRSFSLPALPCTLTSLAVISTLLAVAVYLAGQFHNLHHYPSSHLHRDIVNGLHFAQLGNHNQYQNNVRYASSGVSKPSYFDSPAKLSYDAHTAKGTLPYSVDMPRYASVAHSACGEDFTVQEAVPTFDCSRYRNCRARVVVSKHEAQISIAAGYYIFTGDGKVRSVDSGTKRRVSAVTAAEAQKWANKLMGKLSNRLEQLSCVVSSEMIADAILSTTGDAASCSRTGDPLCSELVIIKECSVPVLKDGGTGGTEKQKECLSAVRAAPVVSNYWNLPGQCQKKFFYKRLDIPLPLCVTTCPSNPCVQHTVYAKFYVSSNTRSTIPKVRDCVSASFILAYNTLYDVVPSCEELPPSFKQHGPQVNIPIASKSKGTIPRALASHAASRGCEISSVYFYLDSPSVEDYLNSSCMAV